MSIRDMPVMLAGEVDLTEAVEKRKLSWRECAAVIADAQALAPGRGARRFLMIDRYENEAKRPKPCGLQGSGRERLTDCPTCGAQNTITRLQACAVPKGAALAGDGARSGTGCPLPRGLRFVVARARHAQNLARNAMLKLRGSP